MGCGGSSSAQEDIKYENGEPTFKGDEVHKGFEKDNGLLFRIVNKKKKMWAFYNDTKEYEMHVQVTFSEDCDIEALGNTKVEKLETGEYLASVVVPPVTTEVFIKGRVNGFKSKMDAVPIPGAGEDAQEE